MTTALIIMNMQEHYSAIEGMPELSRRLGHRITSGALDFVEYIILSTNLLVPETLQKDFSQGIDERIAAVIKTRRESAFDGETDTNEDLEFFLSDRNIQNVIVTGLLTENAVRATAIDSITLGFRTAVWTDYCIGINEENASKTLDVDLPNCKVRII